jgi:hypothetical protein
VREALAPGLAGGRLHALRRSPDRYLSEAALAAIAGRAGKLLPGDVQAWQSTVMGPLADGKITPLMIRGKVRYTSEHLERAHELFGAKPAKQPRKLREVA